MSFATGIKCKKLLLEKKEKSYKKMTIGVVHPNRKVLQKFVITIEQVE